MPELKFKPPIWISIYISAIQYLSVLIFAPVLMMFLATDSNIYLLLLMIFVLGWLIHEIETEGFVLFKHQGLQSYSLGQFAKSSQFLFWDEIYQAIPYRYFGLCFLLVRFHSSATPLWLPLFLINQTKLNLLILEYTEEGNLLHQALLEPDSFKKVPWHSRVKQHKSDRYILESAYTDKISNSFRQYCVSCLIPIEMLVILLTLIIERNILDRLFWLNLVIISGFCILSCLLFWYLFLRHKYIAIKHEGIEICSQFGKSFVPWSEIEEIKSYGVGIFKELRIWLKEPVGKIHFVTIRTRFIDRQALKRSIQQTNLENPLHQAVIKYF